MEGLDGVRAIAAGDEYMLVLRKDGTVWGWGRNCNGQVNPAVRGDCWSVRGDPYGGVGRVPPRDPPIREPVRAEGLENAVAIAAGPASLAITRDGTEWMWGGEEARLRRIEGLPPVRAAVLGYNHNLALAVDGSVWGWGWNCNGALGIQGTGPVEGCGKEPL